MLILRMIETLWVGNATMLLGCFHGNLPFEGLRFLARKTQRVCKFCTRKLPQGLNRHVCRSRQPARQGQNEQFGTYKYIRNKTVLAEFFSRWRTRVTCLVLCYRIRSQIGNPQAIPRRLSPPHARHSEPILAQKLCRSPLPLPALVCHSGLEHSEWGRIPAFLTFASYPARKLLLTR